jgi:hypothetical protein
MIPLSRHHIDVASSTCDESANLGDGSFYQGRITVSSSMISGKLLSGTNNDVLICLRPDPDEISAPSLMLDEPDPGSSAR